MSEMIAFNACQWAYPLIAVMSTKPQGLYKELSTVDESGSSIIVSKELMARMDMAVVGVIN